MDSISTNARYVKVKAIEEVKAYQAPTDEDAAMVPGTDGIELAKEIRLRWPDIPVVWTTG